MSYESDSLNFIGNSGGISMPNYYRQEIVKRVVQYCALFYLVYGIFVTYIWTSMALDNRALYNGTSHYFWDPIVTVYSLSNIAVFSMVIVNKYWTYRAFVRVRVKRSDNHLVMCFVLIPLFITSVIFNITKFIWEIVVMPCHGYMTFLVPLSTLTLLVAVAILIFDNNVGYFNSKIDAWKKTVLRSNLIFFILIGLANCLLMTMAIQHVKIFRNQASNITYGDRIKVDTRCIDQKSLTKTLRDTFQNCNKYLRPTFILFCLCTLAYLIETAIQRKDPEEEECLSIYQSASDTIVCSPEISIPETSNFDKPSYRLPSKSLVVCIVFLSLCLLGFIIICSLRHTSTHDWHHYLGGIIYCSIGSTIYVIGSVLSVVHIKEIGRWPLLEISTSGRRIIDKCLLWVGAGGQLTVALSHMSMSIVMLIVTHTNPSLIGSLCMIIVLSLLLVIQTFLQTVQISLLLDRKWIRPRINSLVESLCPAVGMMGLNMGLLLLSVNELNDPILLNRSNILFIDLFSRELRCVGDVLCVLQRLHAGLLFASMIVSTHN